MTMMMWRAYILAAAAVAAAATSATSPPPPPPPPSPVASGNPLAPGPDPSTTYSLLVDPNLSFDEQVLYFAFQGLANRNTPPPVYYIQPAFWTYNLSTQWFAANYLPTHGINVQNVTSFCDLFASAGGATGVLGLALYDADLLDSTRWLAVTSSGLDSLLPVSPSLLANPLYSTCLGSLPVRANFTGGTARFASNLAAYDWALANLMPRCNKTLLYSAGHSYTDSTESVYLGGDPAIIMGVDIAVALSAFVFNLSPDTTKYAAEAAEWAKIESALNPGKLVFGWAEPEPDMTMSTSKVGGAVLCDAAPNLSFWARLPSPYPAFPYNSNPAIALDRSKYYVTFQTNEGDTPKIAASLQGGVWIDERRGQVPIAWGINPLVALYAPALLSFYAQTATANDTFFSATAGAGYAYPWVMGDADFTLYVRRAAALIDSVTPGWPQNSYGVDIWDNNNLTQLARYRALAGSAAGLFSMQPEEMPGSFTVLPDGTPVVIGAKSLWYPCSSGSDTFDLMQANLEALAAAHPPPFFTVVYGCLNMNGNGTGPGGTLNIIDFALEMQARLGAGAGGDWVVVGEQDLARLARQAGEERMGG
jgi:hypothetical protein